MRPQLYCKNYSYCSPFQESYTEDDYLGANVTTVLEDSHDSIPQAHCDSGRSSILNSISRRNPKKRKIGEKKVTGDFNELMGVTTTKLRNSCLRQDDDDFDITGKKVAADLRTIDTRQRVFVEKLIADAMYYGKLGKLNESSQIQLK